MSPAEKKLRSNLIRLASENPDLRNVLLPLLKEGRGNYGLYDEAPVHKRLEIELGDLDDLSDQLIINGMKRHRDLLRLLDVMSEKLRKIRELAYSPDMDWLH